MTVCELVNILLDMPQDADVYRYNTSYAYGYTDSEESVSTVELDEYGYSVTIK